MSKRKEMDVQKYVDWLIPFVLSRPGQMLNSESFLYDKENISKKDYMLYSELGEFVMEILSKAKSKFIITNEEKMFFAGEELIVKYDNHDMLIGWSCGQGILSYVYINNDSKKSNYDADIVEWNRIISDETNNEEKCKKLTNESIQSKLNDIHDEIIQLQKDSGLGSEYIKNSVQEFTRKLFENLK